NNKARAWESLGFAHKKRLCQHFDTTSSFYSASCLPNMVHPGLPVESCSFALSFLIYKLPSIDSVATVVLPH
ncbi:hypothetical protein F2Y87_27370, partial [Bacteroides cellulosilyticus]